MNALKVSFHKLIARFFFEDKGVTAIEYGLIAGLIALLIIAGVSTLGKNLSLIFGSVATSVWLIKPKIMFLKATKFFSNEKGGSAIEVALIAALVALLIIAGVTTLGTKLSLIFSSVASSV